MAIATSKNDIDNIKIEENYDNRNIKCCIHKSSNASNLKNTKPESLRNNSITGSCSLKKATNSTNNSLKNNKIKDKRKHSENFISHDTSVAERIQQWNRAIPQTSYVTLGTIRYGIRLSTNSDPSNFHSEKTSNSSSSSKSLPPTPYSTRSNKLIKNRRGSEQNEIKSNISSGSDSSCQSFKNTYISSNLNIDISNNSGSNNSNSNSSKSDNNIQDISNKENSSSNSKTSSIYHCESEKSNSSNKNCCKSACCCLYKRGIAIPCWNKNLCNRNNNNDSSIRKKCNEQDNDIPLETFTVKSANYRIPTRTTTTTSTKKSSISTKKSQFPSISSFSSTELSPSITYPFSRSTVMSAPKIDCLATSTTLSESSAEIATTTATIAHITDTTKFENQHKILLNDDINAPIPPIRTTSQIPYLKSLENNNGKAYNNGNINNNYSNNNNNNTIIKTSRLKSNQKHDETKNLTKIPTAAVNNSHLDNHFMYIVSSTSTQLPSLSSSSSISQAPLSSTTALSSATLSPLGSITTTRIITKNAIPSYTQSYKKDIVLNEVNAENYSKHTNNITKLCNNCFINQQYNYNNYHQLQQENNSIKINGSSSHHHHEKNYKMCQTPSCSCSNIKNSVVKNSNDHVCCSHHEIKNTTDEQQNHQQQQQQQQNTNENEFGQNSRDNNIENSSSVLAETRTCKFTKIISPPSLALRENFDIISYPLQNSKSLPISSSLLTKHQNSKHISFGNNSNNNNEKNGINNTFNNNFIQRNGTNENCTIAKSSCNLKDIKDNSNFKNQNDQNNYENISLKNNSSNNFKCSGNFDCSCSNNNKEILQNKNNYLPQPQKIYGGSIPRAIIQQTLDTVAQRSLGTDRKNSDTNGYDKTKTCIITPSTNGFNTLRQRRLSPPPPVPPKPNRHQQVVRSKSVDSNVNNYQNSTDSLTEHIINSSKDINENQNFNQNYYNESTTDFNNINNNNKSNNCDSDSISSAAYDPSKFRRKLLKFEQKNFIIKKSPSAGLDLLNCFAKSNTSDDNSTVSRQSGSSNDLANINSIVSTNNIRNKNHHQNGINRSFSYNNTTSTAKLKDNKGNHNGVNNKIDTNNSPFLQRKTSIVSAKNQQNSESDITSEIKLYSNTTPSVVIRKLTPKLTRKTLNFGSNNDSNSNIYIKNRAVSEDRLIDDNSSDNNDLNSYCDSLGSVNDPIIDTHSNNTNINNNSNSDPNFLIFGEPIPLVPIYKKTKTIISPILYNEQTSTLKCKSIDSQSTDDIGFIDSSEKEDSDFDLHLISNDNNQYNNNNNSLLRNILDYPKSVTIQKNSHFNLQFDSNTKLLQLNKENDKTKFINETNNNTINNNNNNNAINDNTNNKINDHTSIINDRIIFKDFYDSLSDSLETSTISCLSETTTATTTTTDLLTNINCGCRFQNNNNNNNNTIINSNHSNISLNNNEICNSNENITKSISDIDLCLLNNINENGLKKSPDLCCCNERVKRFCRELKNQEVDHSKNLQNNNNNISVDNKIHINNDNNKQIRIFKSNSENFIRNKEFINQFLVNHLNNHNQNLNSNIINSNISSDDKTKAHNNNNILIDNNIKRNTYNNNKNITNFDLNYPIISSSSSTSTIISPTNSSTSIPLSSLPPLPPPLPPLQFRNNHNNNNNNITIDNNNSEKIRYDWNELSADLNSISYNSSSDSNSIHSNNSNQSSISNISSNINCCGGNNNNNNLQKNIQFKKIPSIESFGYINNNNLFFGKLRNIEDNNNSIQDKDQPIKAVVKNNMERRRNTLDRLQDQIRLNFGRRSSPSPTQQEKQRKSAEKSEKLRELTELLRGSPSSSSHSNRFSPTPPPIPPPRKPRQSSQQSSFEKSTEKLPPDPGPPPSPVSPLRAADSDDILPMDQEIEDEPHRYSAPQLTSSSTNSGKITQSPSPPPLPPPPPPPLPPQPLFSTQSTFNIHLKSKKKNEEKPLTAPIHESTEQNHKSLLMSSLRPNSSVSNLEAFIFGRSSRGKSKSPPPFTSLITKSTSKDESTSAEDDICTSLPKPESRTIIGSYTQKGIPYRSASFSQIDYSSGKYVKSALNAFRERFRKSQDKNQADSVVDRTNLTLPRKKDDQDISSQETKTKEPDFIYIPLKKSELSINLRYDENEKPSLEDRVNPPEIIMEEDSQMSELDSPMRTEADISPDISEASDSVIVPTTILEGKSDENQNKIFPKSSPINVSREGSTTSELTNSNGKDLLMESPPDKVKTTTTCLIPIPVYESTDFNTFESKDVLPDDSQSVEGIPTVLEEEPNISLEKPQQTHDNSESPDNVPRISVSQNTPQGSIDEEGDSPSLAGEINPERLTVDQTFDEQPTVPTLVEEVLNRPLEFTEVKKRYSNEAAIGDRSHSADSILSRGGHSDEKRKRDKSKRRMGLYFQWPAVETTETAQANTEWNPSIESSPFEDKTSLPLDITKVDFSNLKSDGSQNETLSLFLNDTLNQSESMQTPESGYICEISTPESESYSKPKIWSRFNRRTSLTCQSSEEKDDGSSPAPSINRSNRNLLCFKNDSTSDNESDRTPPPSRDRTSPSPAPGDSDFKRYSKRPLRGPYGQMLEAEMKKPGKVHYDEIFDELKENDNLHKTQTNRPRGQNNRSFDDTRTIPQHSNSMRVRKTANLPIPTHTRAASTPSQMESTSSSPGSNRASSKEMAGSLEEPSSHLTAGKTNKKYSNDMHRERSPKRASSEAPDMKLINHTKRSPSSASDRHQFVHEKAQKRSFEEVRFSQSSRTNSERSTMSESSKSGGGGGGSSHTNLMPSPELLAALLKGSSERQISEQRQQTIADTRNHIVEEIYRTEASYVDALTTIVTKYYNVLKTPECAGLIDTKAVDEIFFMSTELLSIHRKYYNDLNSKPDPLDPTLCCESFLETFSQTEVLETYTCFVNNRDRAHEAVKTAVQARPAFGKFLEATAREQKGKLSLDNLLIKPIQKFVNYEMLFTRLLKHTDSDIDQKPIQDVLKLVHDILLHLDCKKKEINENGQREDALRQYETYIEGISDLVAPERQFLIYDLVQLPSHHTSNHMRGLFLFSDLLVITSIKRRSGAIKKQDFRSNTSTLDINFASTLENIKYKFLRKFPLEYVEIVKTQDENARRIEKDYEQLVDDRSKIQQIDSIQTSIKFQSALHQVLEQTIRNYLSEVETRLTECERQLNDGQFNSLKFMINIPGDSQHVTVLFGKAERRAKWEELFNDAKQKLAACLERHPTPEFLRSIALRKTRAGLQFTCAAPTLTDQKDVWVCNSDGYIGQVAVLSIQENPPTVSSCNGVCNARILCIASVPAYKETRKSQSRQSSTEEAPQSCRNSSSSDNSKKTTSSSNTTATTTTTTGGGIIKESCSMPAGISAGNDLNEIQLDSNSSSDDSDPEQLGNISGTNNEAINVSGTIGVVGGNPLNTTIEANSSSNQENRISSPIPKTISSISNLSTIHHQQQDSNSDDMESQQSTMWLGTEDGCIHVYNSTDNIRIKKNKIKIEHSSSVYSILYYDNKVFVSLANGDICVYLRDNVGWNTSHPLCISIGTVSSPVNKLLNVNGKLWCTIQGTIKVLDTKTLQVESTIQISSDSKPITNMAMCNNCVWISIQNSAIIKCFHSTSHELIFEVNLAPSVNKMLSNCDDIIRQHKAACLRVTSLLACKDLIWIGTSAGVLLTIPAQSYIKGQTNNAPAVTGIPHGHTGHVRFLTSVESNLITATSTIISSDNQEFDTISSNNSYNLNNNNNNNNSYNNNNNINNNSVGSSNIGNASNNRSNSRTRSEIGSSNNLNSCNITTTKYSSKSVDSSLDRKSKRNTIHNTKDKTKAEAGKTLIISGGDGYENFGNSNSNSPSEIAGREDSTNHLLLWQI